MTMRAFITEPQVPSPDLMDNEPISTQEHEATFLFQPERLITVQYLDTSRDKPHLEPEQSLMLAVLQDAVFCFQKNLFAPTNIKKALFQEAEDWILEKGCDWLFSFENICEALGINAKYLQKGLMDWKRRKLEERPIAKVYQWNQGPKKDSPCVSISEPNRELKYGII